MMNNIKQGWLQASLKVEALSLRERGILSATLLVAILFAWAQFYLTPVQKKIDKAQFEINQINTNHVALSEQLAALNQKLQQDPNKALRIEEQRLKKKLETLKDTIEKKLSGLIAPEHMAEILHALLKENQTLKLVSIRNLPVEPFKQLAETGLSEEPLAEQGAATLQTELFTHGMEIEVEGRYFDILRYIQKVEGLAGFYWQTLSYEVTQYPEAKAIIRVTTLSLEDSWIGV